MLLLTSFSVGDLFFFLRFNHFNPVNYLFLLFYVYYLFNLMRKPHQIWIFKIKQSCGLSKQGKRKEKKTWFE